jgi:SAM-dependent methyltransferase
MKGWTMFDKSTQYYDRIYAWKDYQGECAQLTTIIGEHLRSGADRLLDVACGTGHHLAYLKESFDVEGLDLSSDLLQIAENRNPGVPFHQGDMLDFALDQRFDVITNLFSSIGYTRTIDNLNKAIASMARHLAPGGVLIVEPWFTPEQWSAGTVHALYVDDPELKIARINLSGAEGRLSYMDFHYLIGTLEGVEHFTERHELGLFEVDEMVASFTQAGLKVTYDEEGIAGRGLYIGTKAA